MKRISAFSLSLAACLVLSITALSNPLLAEGENGGEGTSAYSVARLKLFNGTAWVRTPDAGDWEEFTTNSPVTEKSRISIPEGSEAELQFHGGQFVLLTGGTEIDARRFDEEISSFRLRAGEIRFDLPQDDFSPTRVAIPGGGIANFQVPGRYWLNTQEEGQTRLVVRRGEAVVTLQGDDIPVRAGEEAMIGDEVRVSAYEGPEEDGYQAPPPLSGEEENVDAPPAAVRELRDYGEWVYTRDYGYVWRPMVAEGWSPYYYGRWIWVSPFGWTWLSYEPWGWYPYHYGNWVIDSVFGWVWCPYRSFVSVNLSFGHVGVRHFHRGVRFLPGTVRFVREGRNVRWVPLRPGERFARPAFGRSDARLARWERPLGRSVVYYRGGEVRGKAEWRDWSAGRPGRHDVVVGPRRDRGTAPSPRPGAVAPPRDRNVPARQRPESVRPERNQRMEQRSRPQQKKDVRAPEGRSAPQERKMDTAPSVRPERNRPQIPKPAAPPARQQEKPIAGPSGSPDKGGRVEKQERSSPPVRGIQEQETRGQTKPR